VKKIFIEISRRCNKNCYYCYNTKKGRHFKSPDTNKILSSIIELSGREKDLGLVFSGGEPAYNISEIDSIILELKKRHYKTNITLITNVETYNKKILSFLYRHKPYLVLSYNKKVFTNLHKITKILTKEHIFVRFTITPENTIRIYTGIKKCLKKGLNTGISPAYGINWNKYSLKSLANLYSKLASDKDRNLIYDFNKILSGEQKLRKYCQSLYNPDAIDFYGNIHSCHRAIYFPQKNIKKSLFNNKCKLCPAYKFCTPCVFKDIPGKGCKIRVAISPAYELLYNERRLIMKKKVKIQYKGKKIEVPENIIKKYLKTNKNSKRKSGRNFYELGESDCY